MYIICTYIYYIYMFNSWALVWALNFINLQVPEMLGGTHGFGCHLMSLNEE